VCPYTFADDTLTLNTSCDYSGPFSNTPGCPNNLSALFSGNGSVVGAAIGTTPVVTFFGTVESPTSAALFAYAFADDPIPQPVTGVLLLQQGGTSLVIDPDTVPFNIGPCSFDRFDGSFTQVKGGS